MRITRIDCEGSERVLPGDYSEKAAVVRAVELAKAEALRIPNNPIVDQTGGREVSVLIGIQKIVSFRVGGPMMVIKPGYGYWDLSQHPVGGDFRRADKDGMGESVFATEPVKRDKYGVDMTGTTANGHRVAFDSANADTL